MHRALVAVGPLIQSISRIDTHRQDGSLVFAPWLCPPIVVSFSQAPELTS
jgi:hypothetical protein